MSNSESFEEASRSRRSVLSSSKARQQNVLEQIKQARAKGKTFRARVDDLIQDVYMEVDDEEYQAKKQYYREFVEDDDGAGYYDEESDDDDIDEQSHKKKLSKEKKRAKPKTGTIKHHFQSISNKQRPQDEGSIRVDDDDILKECLADLVGTSYVQENLQIQPSFGDPFSKFTTSSPPKASSASTLLNDLNFDPVSLPPSNLQITHPSTPQQQQPNPFHAPSSPLPLPEPIELDIDFPTFEEVEAEPICSPKNAFDKPACSERKRDADAASSESPMAPPPKMSKSQVDSNESLKFFFVDAFEDIYKHPGTVYLFGLVKTLEGRTENCCLVLKNITRQLFFLKRKIHKLTGQPVTKEELYKEVQHTLQTKFGISNFKCKPNPTEKKIISADESVPKECEALEVWLNCNFGRIPADLSGDCFSHVVNTTTTALERLLVERDIFGPCWLDVQDAVPSEYPISHCPFEYTVNMEMMKSISMSPSNSSDPPPHITLASINVLTAFNPENKENQIIMASLIHYTCNLEKPTNFDPKSLLNKRFCVVSKFKKGLPFPFDLDTHMKNNGIFHMVRKVGDEVALLNILLTKLEELNPDMILGHDLNAQLGLLQARLEKHKLRKWDRLGRLKRSVQIQKIGHTKFSTWELTAGRLCLDSKAAAMELVHSKSYEMSELLPKLVKIDNRKDLTTEEISEPFLTTNPKIQLVDLIKWNWNENYYAMRLIEQMNAIPLFVQITQIVGGVLSRTLLGGRAERNEYLLLHACFSNNDIPPDKHLFGMKGFKTDKLKLNTSNKKNAKENVTPLAHKGDDDPIILDEEDENINLPTTKTSERTGNVKAANKLTLNKKAQYTGGLVLEPKKGFYETFIILLDFNSLYPSIIQEFNICFTTVDRAFADLSEDELPIPPGSSRPDGILKKEIRKLVTKRREVKDLMAKEKPGTDKYKQYNIRQMGLKLTANSMYGCLGFANSRFFAKTLAAMVTSKGRELLMHTKTLVENENYSVIYGDTDSIMVNTNTTNFQQAKQIAQKLKQVVNKNYTLLELDIDGIYKRLLLLKKKKYAGLTVSLNDENLVSQELKGLDIVRRDWSELAKEIGEEVVNLILSTSDRDTLVERIKSTLAERKQDIEMGRIPLEKFEILKQLTRDPADYKDMKSQPHAAVALRLNESQKYRLHQGDVVKYIICKDGTNSPATQRAYHSSEILANDDLSVDIHYYFAQQIHPVVTRLCEPLEEIDACQIAEIIGLDPSVYRRRVIENRMSGNHSEAGNGELFDVGFQRDFNACEGLSYQCPGCDKLNVVRSPVVKKDNELRFCLAQCVECGKDLRGFIQKHLTLALNEHIRRNLQDPYICDDVACGAVCSVPAPSQISIDGIQCTKCQNGIAKKMYTDKKLYDQQCFFRTITELQDALPASSLNAKEGTKYNWMREHYVQCRKIVCSHMGHNTYNKVDLSLVFSPLLRISSK